MKKLLIVAPSFAPLKGGVESHLKKVIPVIMNRGYDITIVTRYHTDIPPTQNYAGTNVIRLPKNSIGLRTWIIKNTKLLKEFDAVHTHDYFPDPLYKKLNDKVSWVHTFHGYEEVTLLTSAIQSRQEVRRKVQNCIGVGRFIEKWYGTKCNEWIYGAISTEDIPKERPPKWDIIFYGRLEQDTGIKTYLEAFEILSKQNMDLSMAVVGSGSLEIEMKEFVTSRNLNVEFMGSTDKVLEYVSMSRIAFVSGYLAIIESAAIGLNIVCVYDTPIKKDYLEMHPMAKYLKICKNPLEVVDAFNEIKDKDTNPELKKWARNQTWSKIADIYVKYYELSN